MSKAQARQGAGRSGTARAGTSGKRNRAAGAGSASANGGVRAGAKTAGARTAGAKTAGARTAGAKTAGAKTAGARAAGSGAQRGSANSRAKAGTQRGSAGAKSATAIGQRRPGAAAVKATGAKAVAGAPVDGKRRLLGMTGIEASTFILSIIGLGVAVYATILHYDSNLKPICSASGAINCEAVMTSPQSVVFGIFPVAVLGMAFFLFMIAINSPWAWRAKFPAFLDRFGGRALSSRPDAIRWTRLGAIIVGMGFALYLIYAELVQVGKICLWCTSVHIVTFLLFVIIVFNASFSWGRTEAPSGT